MLRIAPKSTTKSIRTIEQEMIETRARYAKYLKERTDNFVAKRSNVEIRDPHTMAGDSYWQLRDEINTINNVAKQANKEVRIEDARSLIRDDEFASPTTENILSSKILIRTRDKSNGLVNRELIDRFESTATDFLKKIIDVINAPIKP